MGKGESRNKGIVDPKELAQRVEDESLNFNPEQWGPAQAFIAIATCYAGYDEDAVELGLLPQGYKSGGFGFREIVTLHSWLTDLLVMNQEQVDELARRLLGLHEEEEEGEDEDRDRADEKTNAKGRRSR